MCALHSRLLRKLSGYWTEMNDSQRDDYQYFGEIHQNALKRLFWIGSLFTGTQIVFQVLMLVGNQFSDDEVPSKIQFLAFTSAFFVVFSSLAFIERLRNVTAFCIFKFQDLIAVGIGTYVSINLLLQHSGELHEIMKEAVCWTMILTLIIACSINYIRHKILKITFSVAFLIIFIAGQYDETKNSIEAFVAYLTSLMACLSLLYIDYYRGVEMLATLKEWFSKEKDYKLILNTIPQVVLLVTNDLEVVFHNNHGKKLLDQTLEDISEKLLLTSDFIVDMKPREELDEFFTILPSDGRDQVEEEGVMFKKLTARTTTRFTSQPSVIKETPRIHESMTTHSLHEVLPNFGLVIKKLLRRATLTDDSTKRLPANQVAQEENNDDCHFFCYDGVLKSLKNSRNVEVRICPSKYNGRAVAVVVINDLSQLRENIELREKTKLQNLLLGSVSHEIRSPLNATIAILNCANQDTRVDDYIRETYVSLALTNSTLLLHIVNDILDYSQLNFNKIRIVNLEFDLEAKLNDLIKLLQFQAKAKGISLYLEFDKDRVPPIVKTDANRLSQILINLINNALKFTETGFIKVKVTRAGHEYQNNLRFSVEDSGLGISKENQAILFNTFVKIDLGINNKMNASGAGLGLTLCQSLLKLLGSRKGLEIKSEPGTGSIFSFSIPCISAITLPPCSSHGDSESVQSPIVRPNLLQLNLFKITKKQGPSADRTPRAPKTVWMVDDSPFNILALEIQLKDYPVEVKKYYDPEKLLDDFLKLELKDLRNIGIIFVDLMMPKMSGIELVRNMRRKTDDVVIIACSGDGEQHMREAAFEAGFTDFLLKPVLPEHIAEVFNKYYDV